MKDLINTSWNLQRQWSLAANGLKRSYSQWQGIVLGLAVAGAVLETLSALIEYRL